MKTFTVFFAERFATNKLRMMRIRIRHHYARSTAPFSRSSGPTLGFPPPSDYTLAL